LTPVRLMRVLAAAARQGRMQCRILKVGWARSRKGHGRCGDSDRCVPCRPSWWVLRLVVLSVRRSSMQAEMGLDDGQPVRCEGVDQGHSVSGPKPRTNRPPTATTAFGKVRGSARAMVASARRHRQLRARSRPGRLRDAGDVLPFPPPPIERIGVLAQPFGPRTVLRWGSGGAFQGSARRRDRLRSSRARTGDPVGSTSGTCDGSRKRHARRYTDAGSSRSCVATRTQ
jgi:hypothetical protein